MEEERKIPLVDQHLRRIATLGEQGAAGKKCRFDLPGALNCLDVHRSREGLYLWLHRRKDDQPKAAEEAEDLAGKGFAKTRTRPPGVLDLGSQIVRVYGVRQRFE